jgi:integrase
VIKNWYGLPNIEFAHPTKTSESGKRLPLDAELVEVLRLWHSKAQFNASEDWVFASPVQFGPLPCSYDQVWRHKNRQQQLGRIERLGTLSLRHAYRSWLDAVGTPIAVQQKLMRHTDVRTTMDYGDVVINEIETAHRKLVKLALN